MRTIRDYVELKSFHNENGKNEVLYPLLPLAEVLNVKLNSKELQRLVSVTVLGLTPEGKPRGPLIVGDDAETQLQYIPADKDFIVNGLQDLQKLRVCSFAADIPAVLVIQL